MLTFYLALRNVARNRERSLLTLIGVMLAIGAYVALVSLAEGLGRRMAWELDSRAVDIYVLPQRALALPSGPIGTIGFSQDTIARDTLRKIAELPNTGLADGVQRESWTGRHTTFPVLRLERASISAFFPQIQGLPEDLSDRQIIVGQGLARQEPGKKIQHGQTQYDVAAVISGGGFQDYFAFVKPSPAGDGYHEIWIQLRDPNLALGDARTMRDWLPKDCEALTRSEYLERTSSFLHYAWLLQASIASIGVLIAITASMNTMLMSTYERLREFAVLRAVGASRATVALMVLWESLMLSWVGGLLGCLFGVLASGVLDQAVVVLFQLPFPLAHISFSLIVQGMLLSAFVGVCGAGIPLVLIWKQKIMDGLRSE